MAKRLSLRLAEGEYEGVGGQLIPIILEPRCCRALWVMKDYLNCDSLTHALGELGKRLHGFSMYPKVVEEQLRLIDALLAPDSTLPGSCGMVFATASFREAMETVVSGAGASRSNAAERLRRGT